MALGESTHRRFFDNFPNFHDQFRNQRPIYTKAAWFSIDFWRGRAPYRLDRTTIGAPGLVCGGGRVCAGPVPEISALVFLIGSRRQVWSGGRKRILIPGASLKWSTVAESNLDRVPIEGMVKVMESVSRLQIAIAEIEVVVRYLAHSSAPSSHSQSYHTFPIFINSYSTPSS